MQNYLFVHFREKSTPDGEQVRFGISRDGLHWNQVNNGEPVLWAYHGDKGVRDFTIVRCETTGKFHIVATDLSLSYGFRNQYHHSWDEISRNGSHCLAVWDSEDLVHWSDERLVQVVDDDFGCCWAPDIIRDKKTGEYIVHWTSPNKCNNYGPKAIYCARTTDFVNFTAPKELFRKPDGREVIDSAIYEENGYYYLFVKSMGERTTRIALYRASDVEGPYEKYEAFEQYMDKIQDGLYEAPTAVKLEDGRWCLFLDFYGAHGADQGYVPFIADSLEKANFIRADGELSFPYNFKHGTILKITPEEYDRIASFDFSDKGWI